MGIIAVQHDIIAIRRLDHLRFRLSVISFLMTAAYLPVSAFLIAGNISSAIESPPRAYDFERIHSDAGLYPWNSVFFVPSSKIVPLAMNQAWFSIMTTVPIIAFYGTNEESIAIYRLCLGVMDVRRYFSGLSKANAPAEHPHHSLTRTVLAFHRATPRARQPFDSVDDRVFDMGTQSRQSSKT